MKNIYKSIIFGRRKHGMYRLAYNYFPSVRKQFQDVYRNGYRYWETHDEKHWSFVLGNHRIILSKKMMDDWQSNYTGVV